MSHSNHVDIERAKRELNVRRAETVQRHADEICKLDAERAELETLEKLLASFSQKFGAADGSAEPAEDPVVAATPPVVHDLPQPSSRSKYQQTNFEIFSRAAAFGTF